MVDAQQTPKSKPYCSMHQAKECVFLRQGLSAISHEQFYAFTHGYPT